jgi:transcriptional regulator with XRE-family HTH domain
MTFGKLLEHLRNQCGLTCTELGRRSCYDRTYITRLELDEREPKRFTILQIAKALECTPDEEEQLLAAAGYASERLQRMVLLGV